MYFKEQISVPKCNDIDVTNSLYWYEWKVHTQKNTSVILPLRYPMNKNDHVLRNISEKRFQHKSGEKRQCPILYSFKHMPHDVREDKFQHSSGKKDSVQSSIVSHICLVILEDRKFNTPSVWKDSVQSSTTSHMCLVIIGKRGFTILR